MFSLESTPHICFESEELLEGYLIARMKSKFWEEEFLLKYCSFYHNLEKGPLDHDDFSDVQELIYNARSTNSKAIWLKLHDVFATAKWGICEPRLYKKITQKSC